jgi:hypothetical protein
VRLAIDPGISSGWALFDGAALVACAAGDPRHIVARKAIASVMIECPQAYPRSKVDPNNLITLAVRVGRYAQHFEALGAKVSLVLPHDWKGNVDKVVNCNRVLLGLTPVERTIYEPAARGLSDKVRMDLLDALGLGKWTTKLNRWA